MDQIAKLFTDRIPPAVLRFVKLTGRGINEFDMIGDGDSVLLGVSGGKDSLAMSLALALRKRWLPVDYSLSAVVVDWREYPIPEGGKDNLRRFFDAIGVSLEILPMGMFPESFRGVFNCYLCARNRKRALFERAKKMGVQTVALGHNMDDVIETTIINLALRGQIATMMPVQQFFGGSLKIIRPMCMVKENSIRRIAESLALPIVHAGCPRRDVNIRSQIKPLISQLVHLDKHAREHIFRAPWHINTDYLPTSLNKR